MKAVATEDLRHKQRTDDFSKAQRRVQTDAYQMVRTTFSLRKHDIRFINDTAAQLTKSGERPVSASQALRHILDGARE